MRGKLYLDANFGHWLIPKNSYLEFDRVRDSELRAKGSGLRAESADHSRSWYLRCSRSVFLTARDAHCQLPVNRLSVVQLVSTRPEEHENVFLGKDVTFKSRATPRVVGMNS